MDKKRNVYHLFSCIHEEVVSKIKAIKKLEIKAQQTSELIAEKEPLVNSLRREVSELKEHNNECNETIKEYNLERKKYEDQAVQLLQIIEELNKKINEYNSLEDDKDYKLPDEINEKINKKIDKIVKIVSDEYSPIKEDEIKKEGEQLHEVNKIIQKEINMLKRLEFKQDWDQKDEINKTVIEECEMRYSPDSDFQFQSLESIPIPINEESPSLLEECCVSIPEHLNDIEIKKQNVDNYVQLQAKQDDFICSSYETQAEYLKTIHNELTSKSLTEQDLQRLEYQYQNQLRQMNELTEINPIKIPEIQISSHEDKSIQILAENFSKFCQQIENEHPYHSISEDFLNSAEEALNIPSFSDPPAVPYVKKPVTNSDLVSLSDSLKDLIKSTEKIEELHQIREAVSLQHKHFLEEATKEEADKPKENEVTQLRLPRPLSPPPENLAAIEFKELVKSKLPDMFHSIFDIQDSNLFIEGPPIQNDSNLQIQNDESNLTEPVNSMQINQEEHSTSMNAEERTRAFQEILKDFASFEFPTVPNFTPPTPVELRVKPFDFQPMKEQIDEMLETSKGNITFLHDDIVSLESKVKELSDQLRKELTGSDSKEKFSDQEIENDIKNLEQKKSTIEKEKEKIINRAKEVKSQINEADKEISDLNLKLEEVTITDEMLNEKTEELNAKEAEMLNQLRLNK